MGGKLRGIWVACPQNGTRALRGLRLILIGERFSHNFQSLEVIGDMYQYTEAFCDYSWNSPEAKKSRSSIFTHLGNKIGKYGKIEIFRENKCRKFGKKLSDNDFEGGREKRQKGGAKLIYLVNGMWRKKTQLNRAAYISFEWYVPEISARCIIPGTPGYTRWGVRALR